MDLLATVLVLANGPVEAALVDVDFCVVGRDLADPIRQAVADLCGIPFAHVRLSYTHTHSGPMLGPSWMTEGEELIGPYVASLAGRIAGAAWDAKRRLRPARVAAGSGSSDIVVNRRLKLPTGRVVAGRNWDGFADREVKVVRIDDVDERPLAVIVHYGCHPTIMGQPNRLITPDYPGVVRQVVESATGATCLFLQGAAGNVHAIVDYVGDVAVYRRLGRDPGARGGAARPAPPDRAAAGAAPPGHGVRGPARDLRGRAGGRAGRNPARGDAGRCGCRCGSTRRSPKPSRTPGTAPRSSPRAGARSARRTCASRSGSRGGPACSPTRPGSTRGSSRWRRSSTASVSVTWRSSDSRESRSASWAPRLTRSSTIHPGPSWEAGGWPSRIGPDEARIASHQNARPTSHSRPRSCDRV